MSLETKSLEIIIISKKELDLSKFDSQHKLVNKLEGNGRKEFLQNLSNASALTSSTDLIILLNSSKSLGNSVVVEASYAEIFFSDIEEQNFTQEDLNKAIEDFYSRKRNFGI